MAINISIDSKLIERALEVSGERTKKVWDGDGSSGDWGEGLNALRAPLKIRHTGEGRCPAL